MGSSKSIVSLAPRPLERRRTAQRGLAVLGALSLTATLLISPAAATADPQPTMGLWGSEFLAIGGNVYFSGYHGDLGPEVWRTDGTAEGTQVVTDVSGHADADNFGPWAFWHVGDKLIFTHGALWATDLTGQTSTQLPLGSSERVRNASSSRSAAVLGDSVLFFASTDPDDEDAPVQLWKTDGTSAGTALVKEPIDAFTSNFTVVGDRAVFEAGGALWSTDGTTLGTVEITPVGAGEIRVRGLAGEKAVFSTKSDETELWVTDGTSAGTTSLGVSFANVSSAAEWDDRLFFIAEDIVEVDELGDVWVSQDTWVSDGTALGTYRVEVGSECRSLDESGSGCFLGVSLISADDGVYSAHALTFVDWHGDPFAYDHSLTKTTGVVDGAEQITSMAKVSEVLGTVVEHGSLVVRRLNYYDDQQLNELWVVPSSDAQQPAKLFDGSLPGHTMVLGEANGLAYFTEEGTDVYEYPPLWVTDGTVEGTKQILPAAPDDGEPEPEPVTAITFDAPAVGGELRVGETLNAVVTNLSPVDAALTYQWLRDGKTIKGATDQSYTLTSKDKSKRISVRVVGSAPDLTSVSKTSARTAKIASGVLVVGDPVVSGDAVVGSTLSVDPGVWTVGSKFKYQWYVNGKAVSKATKSTWKVPSSAWGKFVSVRVTGSLSGYTSVATLSEVVDSVEAGSFAATPVPTVSGTVQTGKTIKAVAGTWSPKASLSYQWRLDGAPVVGATKSSWKVPASAMGAQVSVTVTGSATGFVSVQRTSVTSVVLGTLKGATPKITGTAKVGETVTAVPGAWTESATLSYQWLRASSSTGKLTEIAGAVDGTYVLGAADKGKYIAVKVTGAHPDYADLAKTSKRTKKVK